MDLVPMGVCYRVTFVLYRFDCVDTCMYAWITNVELRYGYLSECRMSRM
jgi:hypothetical protein